MQLAINYEAALIFAWSHGVDASSFEVCPVSGAIPMQSPAIASCVRAVMPQIEVAETHKWLKERIHSIGQLRIGEAIRPPECNLRPFRSPQPRAPPSDERLRTSASGRRIFRSTKPLDG
jgi:hypothetical protein